jgi:hypothetical protein
MKLCPQCDGLTATLIRENATGRYFCLRCLSAESYVPPEEPIPLDVYDRIKENVLCLREVQKQDALFDVIWIESESNVQAICYAATVWGPCSMIARPVR